MIKAIFRSKKPKSWCKSISAFANGIGGKLIFGITDNDIVIGLSNVEHDAEIISEQIKERLNPIPQFNLRFHKTDKEEKLIILEVFPGNQTPYYYVADGSLIDLHRVGNQSVPATPEKLRELVIKGSGSSYIWRLRLWIIWDIGWK